MSAVFVGGREGAPAGWCSEGRVLSRPLLLSLRLSDKRVVFLFGVVPELVAALRARELLCTEGGELAKAKLSACSGSASRRSSVTREDGMQGQLVRLEEEFRQA